MSIKKEWLIVLGLIAAGGGVVAATAGVWMWRANYLAARPCPCGDPEDEPFGHRVVDAEMDWENCVQLRAHVNEEGFAVPMQGGGYALSEHRHFEDGAWDSETRYFNTDGSFVPRSSTIAPIARYRKRPWENVKEMCWFDAEGQTFDNVAMGYHRVVWEYDKAGRNVSTRFFDVHGNPVMHKGHKAHRMEDVYEGDKRVASRYYDTEGKLLETRDIAE